MKRPSCLSLLLALAVGLLAAPAAAAAPSIRLVTSSTEAASQSVGLTGVPDDCQSLQVTLSLSHSGVDYAFAADSSLNRAGLYATYRSQKDEGAVTLYITTKTGVLTETGSLTLGTLSTADTLFTVTGATGLKLLDSADGETAYDTVDQNGTSTGGSNGVTTWPIEVVQASGGTLSANVTRSALGNTITLTAAADSGYALESITAADASGKALTLAGQDGKYTFRMPASKVTVTASFARQGEEGGQSRPFRDVAPGVWYDQAVQFVYENGLMSGTGEGNFSPDVTTSRAMIVTILYRQAGSPAAAGGAAFTDVEAGAWYADAVAWASANGIVSGYGEGKFGPNDPITREQMAAILCRYAGHKGLDVSGRADLGGYADAGAVSAYAVDTMRWAVAQGLITGASETTLSPAGSATRAQAALILMRFCGLTA